jgi:nucleoside-specific outer membrane channel protein Tsx
MRKISVFILLLSFIGIASAHENLEEPKEKPYFYWTSTRIDFLPYGWGFQVTPNEQTTFTLEHAHETTIGDFFMFFDGYSFHETEPNEDDNAWYGEATLRLSPAKIFKTDLSFFIFQDVLVAASYELGEDSDAAQALLLGIGFDLKESFRKDLAGVIRGWVGFWKFIQLNIYARKELWENPPVKGFSAIQVSMSGGFEFNVDKSVFLFDGWFDWILGNGPEDPSFHIQPQFKVDVGNYWNWPNKFYAGTEVDLWWNKFQLHDIPGLTTDQYAASILLKYYL